jgi:hypothetical protein
MQQQAAVSRNSDGRKCFCNEKSDNMKKAINAAAAAVVALGPISLFVVTTLFMAPPANACEGGPAAVQLCELACSKGGQSAECPASGAQPAGPPNERRPGHP